MSIIIVGNAGFRIDINGVVLFLETGVVLFLKTGVVLFLEAGVVLFLETGMLFCNSNWLLDQRPIHICCILVHIFHICVNTRDH